VAIVEAAAYGLGLIGSDIGGIPEFVEPGRTGFLFPPGDVPALAALMTQVAQDGDIQPSLAPHSLALAQRFAAERMVENYQAHYEELLDRRADVAAQ
jgi:glycosyltransferase involved in cell wall biosynthesis